MNIEESVKIVNLLHNAYPQDKKATRSDLFQRAETYHIVFADYDHPTVERAARHIIATSKWLPTTAELLQEVKRAYLTKQPETVQSVKVKTEDDGRLDEWLDAFCEWIGFGCEANDNRELPKGVLKYEQ